MDSKLPIETLGKIWELADQDKDGSLDRHEFVVAMHLVYKALEKHAIPNTLPMELMPPPKRKGSTPMGAPLINRGLDGMKPDIPPPPQVAQAIKSMPSSVIPSSVMAPTSNAMPSSVLASNAIPSSVMAPNVMSSSVMAPNAMSSSVMGSNVIPPNAMPPNAMPSNVIPPMARPPNAIPPMGSNVISSGVAPPSTLPPKPVQSVQPIMSWVVTPEERSKSDALFIKSDIDKDGFVSGQEIKDVFLQSGVPQAVLAHIWYVFSEKVYILDFI